MVQTTEKWFPKQEYRCLSPLFIVYTIFVYTLHFWLYIIDIQQNTKCIHQYIPYTLPSAQHTRCLHPCAHYALTLVPGHYFCIEGAKNRLLQLYFLSPYTENTGLQCRRTCLIVPTNVEECRQVQIVVQIVINRVYTS